MNAPDIERRFPVLDIGPYTLQSGITLPRVEVAHAAFGTLNAQGDNALVITHGYTSGPSTIAGRHVVAEGSWARMVGPGQVFDTHKYCVVCPNMLGSAFGSTGPRSIDPATGKRYGPDFPAISMRDIVGVQKHFLDTLGVTRLAGVVGPSYGGWQALQWALDYPDMVPAIGVICSGLKYPANFSAAATRAGFAASPNWHGGWHYERGAMFDELFAMRRKTLEN